MLKDIDALGVEIVSLDARAGRGVPHGHAPDVYDKWKARIGADLVTSAEKAVAAKMSEHPRRHPAALHPGSTGAERTPRS